MRATLKSRMPLITGLAFAALTALPLHAEAQVKCLHSDGGRYTWGQSPKGCDAQTLGDAARAKSLYGSFVFSSPKKDDPNHTKAYMNNMHALIRDLSADYIRSRIPGVSQVEVDTFVQGMHSVATQESYWSHYRNGADGRFRIMTGDSDRSVGMMQLHENSLATNGRAARFDLVNNITLGIEHYYRDWVIAKNASCVKNASAANRMKALARSAYGVYNGGPRSVCRWTNPSDKWYKNDVGFLQKFDGRPWARLVSEPKRTLGLDLECVKAGRTACPGRGAVSPEQPQQPPVVSGQTAEQLVSKLVTLDDGRQCYSSDGKSLHCSKETRTFSCLEAYAPGLAQMPVVKLSARDQVLSGLNISIYSDRDELCRKALPSLITAGQFAKASADLDLLDTKDGAKVSTLKAGSLVQIVDYEVSGAQANIQYRVVNNEDGKLLWVAAGEKGALLQKDMIMPGDQGTRRAIATPGDRVTIVVGGSLRLREKPGIDSKILGSIAQGATVQVKAVNVVGSMGEIWLAVEHNGVKGFISSGRTTPELTADQWVKIN